MEKNNLLFGRSTLEPELQFENNEKVFRFIANRSDYKRKIN